MTVFSSLPPTHSFLGSFVRSAAKPHRAPAKAMTSVLRVTALAALLSTGCGLASAQSLADLLEAARGYDATWQAAKSARDAAEYKAEQARAGLLPTVGLNAGVTQTNASYSSPYPDRAYAARNATVAASQPLYRPANKLSFEQGQKALDIAQAQLAAAEQDLILRTTQAYFDVLAAQDTLTFVKAQKAAVAEQLASAKRNFEVGTATVTDSREAQARYDLVLAQEIAAENDLRVKKLALDNLVGRTGAEPKPLALPVALPATQPADVAYWVGLAESTHPSVRQAQLALDVAQLETDKAKAGHGPTLDLTAQYQVSRAPSSTTFQQIRTNAASVGMQFNLPLFAGFAVQNRVRETLALEDKSRADLEAAKRAVSQATRTAFFGVQSGQGQVKALEAAEVSSQSALDANLLGYQVGVRINIDVLNAQSQLFQTKRDLAKARYDVLVGGLRLKQASGTLSTDDVTAVNALLAR